MTITTTISKPKFRELYTPKLVTTFQEGYSASNLKADAFSGLTVAIVALPLSMAIAIASGVAPDRGLYTSIVGGFIVSALGGSRFQIGGPAGAFIVLVAATLAQHGLDGLLLATLLSGLMLLAIGLLRLGTFIKYIPYPVTVGFTAGIAVIIFASQIKDLLGLTLAHEPGPLIPKLQALAGALPSISLAAVCLSCLSIGTILGLRRLRPHWPGLLIAVVLASVVTLLFKLPVATIGTQFGGIPQTLPLPQLPAISLSRIVDVLPNALSFALLGCIESLLSAVVADAMTGRRHRSNCELVAQGVANIASPLFGGICVTGNIARTATNVRSGAHGPVAGMLHAVFLLLFVLLAAPVASYVPLAALAGVLAVIAWNMLGLRECATLLRASWGDAVVLAVTLLLVVFRDLSQGILIGFSLSALLFLHRMAQAIEIRNPRLPSILDDLADHEEPAAMTHEVTQNPDIAVLQVSGAFFFGAAAAVGAALDSIGDQSTSCVIDLSAVSVMDSSAASTIAGFANRARQRGAQVYVTGAAQSIRHTLERHGLHQPLLEFQPSIEAVVSRLRAKNEQ